MEMSSISVYSECSDYDPYGKTTWKKNDLNVIPLQEAFLANEPSTESRSRGLLRVKMSLLEGGSSVGSNVGGRSVKKKKKKKKKKEEEEEEERKGEGSPGGISGNKEEEEEEDDEPCSPPSGAGRARMGASRQPSVVM
eukprot:gene30751-35787_t